MIPEAAFEIQNLLSFVSAVLGGFSIALAVGLLQLESTHRLTLWATGFAMISAIILIFATVTGAFGAIWIAERPNLGSLSKPPAAVLTSFRWSGSSFMFGILCLLSSIGLSGFIRSRLLGGITSIFSVFTGILIFYFLARVVDVI